MDFFLHGVYKDGYLFTENSWVMHMAKLVMLICAMGAFPKIPKLYIFCLQNNLAFFGSNLTS